MQQRIHQCSGMIACAGVHDEPGGFVDGYQIVVGVKNLDRDIFRESLQRFQAGGLYCDALGPM